MKNKKLLTILGILLFMISSLVVYAVVLDNDVEVEENSELTYYLDVSYDGVDKNGVESSDTTISEITSGYMYVEDKIPEGLTFSSFITSEDGTIGAVKRSDDSACPGYVVDDTKEEKVDSTTCDNNGDCYYHGLHYTKSDNTVRFTVKNLKAGCKLTVGIKTITPSLDGETRKDFYNTASIQEGALTVLSNTVHVYMGNSEETLYKVKYEYTGELPDGVPTLPSEASYSKDSIVGVSGDINIEGYTFSGWSSSDVTVTDGKFTMPNKDIVFKGSFTKNPKYKVTYKIDGVVPENYVVPSTKEYSEGQTVNVDSMKVGDTYNGYKFLGWSTNDTTISDDKDFVMGTNNVEITGKFELIKYKVEYRFYDTVLPPNSSSYLPSTKMYAPGEKVTLESVTNPEGYKFLGWYKEDTFKMPSEDVVIYGEWMKILGEFEPTISIEITNPKEEYEVGDKVEYKIAITNPEDFDIKEVIVKENLDGAKFIKNDNYEVTNDIFVTIDKLKSKETIYLYASYIVGENDKDNITNEVEIKGALADNKYTLKDKEYKASIDFKVKAKNSNTESNSNKNNVNNPLTLDNIKKYVIIFSIAIIGIVIFIIIKRKGTSK